MEEDIKLHQFLQTLGENNRLQIIKFIGIKESSVSEIVEASGLSQPLVSHHLRTLREFGILETIRKGPFVYYFLAMKELLDVLGILSSLAESLTADPIADKLFSCPSWWRDVMSNKK